MTNPKHWNIAPPITPEADANLEKFPPVLRQLLFNRGYGTDGEARAFLKAETNVDTDPFQMTGMAIAIDRLCFAMEHHEPIAIYGDYDVDGVTATALLVQTLQGLGADARGYIPNRFDEGYGLNNEALDALKADGVKLVVTVDCGIRSPNEAMHAREIGLDLIISDHHHPAAGNLPPALAVINPKQAGDSYPDKNLAGVGIAYKMAADTGNEAYQFEIGPNTVSARPALQSLLQDVLSNTTIPVISGRFHGGLARMVADACLRISSETGIREVALSGGVWQNITLLGRTLSLLQQAGLRVYIHRAVPPNDGGLSLGQAAIAAQRLRA